MIVDSSALVAVVLGEDDANRFLSAMTGSVAVSAASLVETTMVVESRQGPDATRDLSLLLDGLHAEIVPVDHAQAIAAAAAWRRFGKGRHPAALKYGDSFAYALAQVRGEPLLFKGDDFHQTDIASVL
ncbi:type II toxin-antitoxin system VapC family toxin [Lapillicoccus sp.]|uniref:type II toxin-antitoxin system VapC family toxin n=1 Tax=Lapillicoccus sp. TaxID=1909287 RepID=UPI0025DDA9C4|nr:type II toxin-antitoxin system VapC family toxin [Lapillicoccus sp.]